jgi:hypothetical protein
VSTSDNVPDFCLGGCVYTKEGDPSQSVTNYCFQQGIGDATCRSAKYLISRISLCFTVELDVEVKKEEEEKWRDGLRNILRGNAPCRVRNSIA